MAIQTPQKRIKLFEYLESYVTSNGFVLLQETHSSMSVFFSRRNKFMRSFNGSYGTKNLEIINKKCGNTGRILLLEINIDNSLFSLINVSQPAITCSKLIIETLEQCVNFKHI